MLTFGKFVKNCGRFEFLQKVAKHKIASISLTVGDRAISSKFLTPRVSKHYTISTSGKFFKNAPGNILEKKKNSQQYSFIAML